MEKIKTAEPVKVEVKDFKEIIEKKPLPNLKRNEVLMVELDKDGKEGKTFVTNLHSAETYFSDENKFQIKKKG